MTDELPVNAASILFLTLVNIATTAECDVHVSSTLTGSQIIARLVEQRFLAPMSSQSYILLTNTGQRLDMTQTLARAGIQPHSRLLIARENDFLAKDPEKIDQKHDRRPTRRAIKIYYCYAHEDEEWRVQLDKHLSGLRQQGKIVTWHQRQINPGTDWKREAEKHIQDADIILLLVSADFINSDYHYRAEMQTAFQRKKTGEAQVISIILRPVNWQDTPLQELLVLPVGGLPVTLWPDSDAALDSIAREISALVNQL